MRTIDIDDATRCLSQLIEQAAKGQAFIITKAGKPMVKVLPVSSSTSGNARRLGFLTGQIQVPDDFDDVNRGEVESQFGGDEQACRGPETSV